MAPRTGKSLYRVVGWALAALVVAFVGRRVMQDLRDLAAQPVPLDLHWSWIALSGLVFLAAHATLVQTWRTVLATWEARLPFWSAARIWSVSNLGRYLPGKIWQIGAMGAMARDVGVSPVAASGSAILATLVNVIAGFAVALVGGRTLLERSSGGRSTIALLLLALGVAALAAAPLVVPRLAALVGTLTGRPLRATLPVRAVLYALAGNVVAWLLYGAAFELFAAGVLGRVAGGYGEYLAAYTISYLLGYLALFAPAGLGVREGAMMTVLTYAGLAARPEAALVALTSRVWLTLLEVVPGFVFWAVAGARPRSSTHDPSDATT